MNTQYKPPTITDELGRPALEAAADRNSLARGKSNEFRDKIDGVAVDDLAASFGSPLFVFSERQLRETARKARQAFIAVYPNTTFAWSYKTNYLSAICNILHQEGWIAEVVSEFEYKKAIEANVSGPDIIYNGPNKPRGSLERALSQGSIIQIDNWDELALIEKLVTELDLHAAVGIRVWMDTGLVPVWSKFGFALANGQAKRVALRIISNPRLRLHTLHSHIGTYILAPEAYKVATERLVAFREILYVETHHLVQCLNLGGGFPSCSVLHCMPDHAEGLIPPIEAYAKAIGHVLNSLPQERRPELRLESGRHIVDEAGSLITSIVATKETDSGQASDLAGLDVKASFLLGEHSKAGYVVDAGVNLLYTSAWYRIGVTPARLSNLPARPLRLYGCLCMNIDVIRENVELPTLGIGDKLVLHPVGAYNVTQWMQFIEFRPAVVLIGLNGSVDVIRRREELSDVEGAEFVPSRLRRT